jgi:hypothetical protein
MIKWIVNRYLNNKLEDLNYQILSLEQELGYADDNEIDQNEEIKLLQAHKKTIWDRNNLRHVIDKVI